MAETFSETVRNTISSKYDKADQSRQRDNHQNNRRGFKRHFEESIPKNEKRSKWDVGNRLKESDIGITEYISEHSGFSAIIKARYSDFLVNEIDLNGKIAKLTHQNIPHDPDENIEDLKEVIPLSVWDQLQNLKEKNPIDVEIDVTSFNKVERGAIHNIAKMLANVVSQTITKDDKKFISIKQSTNNKSDHKDNRINWKRRGGDYCHFILHKVNMDTMDALNRLAIRLRKKTDSFSYAGTKDRRAYTSQWVSLKKIDPRVILKASETIRGAYVGNFKYAKNNLKLGMLCGNQFKIALRNVCGTTEEIEKAMISLRDNGFINYYGLQRFGTIAAIPTHEIGKRLLQGKWNEAIELILKPRPGEQDEKLIKARQIYMETKDADSALREFKKHDKIEFKLLKGLQLAGDKNPLRALEFIPRNTRLMYIHAYQSHVWNHIVSRRIKQYGTGVIIGDLVYDNRNFKELYNESIDDSLNINVNNEGDKDVNLISSNEIEENLKQAELVKADNVTQEEEIEHSLSSVKILTEQDLPNYTLADVIMPQPGWKVTFPPYAKTWFDEFLVKDGLTTDLKQKNKQYSLSGTYRKILEIPTNLSWKIMYYKEKDDDLIIPDIDMMKNIILPESKPDGENKALIIDMCLKPSNYATMALREILKTDTSPEIHAALLSSYNTENVQTNATVDEDMLENKSTLS